MIPLLVNGLLEGTRFGLAGLGFAIIFYTTKELHFAYGAMIAASGYLAYVLFAILEMPAVVTVIAVLLVSALAGILLQRYLYRYLPDPLAVLLFSFGLTIVLENLLHLQFGPDDRVMPRTALSASVHIEALGVFARVIDVVAVGGFIAVWVFMYLLMEKHRTGMALRAVMQDPEMSELVGIRTQRIKVFAYGIGSAIGAIAGLIAVTRTGVRPSAGFDIMLFAFIVTLLGVGRIHRVAAWGLGLGTFMGLVAWQLPTQFRTVLAFAGMLIYLVVREYRVKGTGRRVKMDDAQAAEVES